MTWIACRDTLFLGTSLHWSRCLASGSLPGLGNKFVLSDMT